MHLGEKVLVYPSGEVEAQQRKQVEASVCYIHPERHFFMVEWASVHGDTRRECFYFNIRRGADLATRHFKGEGAK